MGDKRWRRRSHPKEDPVCLEATRRVFSQGRPTSQHDEATKEQVQLPLVVMLSSNCPLCASVSPAAQERRHPL